MTKAQCKDSIMKALKNCYFDIEKDNRETLLMRNQFDEVVLDFGLNAFSIYYERSIHDFRYKNVVDIWDSARGVEIHTDSGVVRFIFTPFGISELDSFMDELKGE